jgi:hypothetical protein
MFSKFLSENRAVYEIMWKNLQQEGATDDNMAHAHCNLDTEGYEHTLRICNAHRFTTATMVNTNTSRCYVIRALSLSLSLFFYFSHVLLVACLCFLYSSSLLCN